MTTHELIIGYDAAESPNDFGMMKVASFNHRHGDYQHPSNFSERDCRVCDGLGLIPTTTNECVDCGGEGIVSGAPSDVLATLAYYEHGSCLWSIGSSPVPDHGGFDTIPYAGVLLWTGTDRELAWFDSLCKNDRDEIMEGFVADYTYWANGETYFVTLSTVLTCGECSHEDEGEVVDSLGGIYGSDALESAVSEILYGYDRDAVKVTGEAAQAIAPISN